ncbi:MAG TPA: ribosome recycling factor [Anaerolineae bacterium]|nr:ribosome recycling factor [Anaerolineae bacterium]
MIEDILLDVEERMEKAVNVLRADLLAIRTGRASPALIERLPVECYGSVLPLNQTATIGVPEPRLLTIRPWDGSIIGDIEKAILKSDLGLTPANDGRIIRLPIPPLTDERRRELARIVGRRVEEGRVAVRNVRRDGIKELTEAKRQKQIPEDEFYSAKDDLQELTDEYVRRMDELGEKKQTEIMEI